MIEEVFCRCGRDGLKKAYRNGQLIAILGFDKAHRCEEFHS